MSDINPLLNKSGIHKLSDYFTGNKSTNDPPFRNIKLFSNIK